MDAYGDLSAQANRQARNDDLQEELEAQYDKVKTLQSALRDANMSTDRLRLTLKEKADSLRLAESTVNEPASPRNYSNLRRIYNINEWRVRLLDEN
jgi:hypothetical protein